MIPAQARLQTSCSFCTSRLLSGAARAASPLLHERHAVPEPSPSPSWGARLGSLPAPPPPAGQPHAGFPQGSRGPHKGNGKIVSHPEARPPPGLLAHNRTFVLSSGRMRRAARGGRHCRALSNAPRKASPQETGPPPGRLPLHAMGVGTQARLTECPPPPSGHTACPLSGRPFFCGELYTSPWCEAVTRPGDKSTQRSLPTTIPNCTEKGLRVCGKDGWPDGWKE